MGSPSDTADVRRVAAEKLSMWSRLRLGWLQSWGWVANLAGYPCIVREGQYESPSVGVSIQVRASNLYTVVTVNGVDVYFYRLTGGFDGGARRGVECPQNRG